LEWTIPSPTPHYNFAEVPIVHSVDDFWHRKYTEDENGRLVALPKPETEATAGGLSETEESGHGIHLPSPSFYPLIVSVGLPIIAYSMIYKVYPGAVVGGLVMLAGLYGWTLEPSAEPAEHHEPEAPAELVAAASVPALEAGAEAEAGVPTEETEG
jgi:cytochrome c oxidase subunit 1